MRSHLPELREKGRGVAAGVVLLVLIQWLFVWLVMAWLETGAGGTVVLALGGLLTIVSHNLAKETVAGRREIRAAVLRAQVEVGRGQLSVPSTAGEVAVTEESS